MRRFQNHIKLDSTTAKKAILWQLMTGSTRAKNNPYSPQVGQRVIDARNALKEAQ